MSAPIVLPCAKCGAAPGLSATFCGEWRYRVRCNVCVNENGNDHRASVALAKWNAENGADDSEAMAMFMGPDTAVANG